MPINKSTLIEAFNEKLVRTGSFDAAFLKAVWVAYLTGLKDAEIETTSPTVDWSELHVQIQPLALWIYEHLNRREWIEAIEKLQELRRIAFALEMVCRERSGE